MKAEFARVDMSFLGFENGKFQERPGGIFYPERMIKDYFIDLGDPADLLTKDKNLSKIANLSVS